MRALIPILSLALFTAQAPQLALPDGNRVWLVQVVTSGGLSGKGGGDFTVSSEGRIVCSLQLRCANDFKPSDLQPLVEVIHAVDLPTPIVPIVSLCRDCITRTITVTSRDSTGVLRMYTASWDDTTKDKMPQEIIRIYDAARGLTK
jgi:hypothetical protein